MKRDEMQQIRDALQHFSVWGLRDEALRILDAALAAPEPQRPVGMVTVYPKGGAASCLVEMSDTLPPEGLYSLYTAPVAALTNLQDRIARIHTAALDGRPKQAYGEMVAAMMNMTEWETVRAALAAEPQQPVVWTSIKDAMPQSGVTVLVCYRNSLGNIRRIRAKWTAAKTVEANAEYDWGEHDEATDAYWTPEGWYECIENWDEFSSIAVGEGEVTHWMPLPLAPDDPNYTAHPSREWQGLTDEEIDRTFESEVWDARRSYARAIEAALRAKNEVKNHD